MATSVLGKEEEIGRLLSDGAAPEVLADLLGIKAAARREMCLTTRTRLAHLPFHRTLEQFDFSFQRSVDKR